MCLLIIEKLNQRDKALKELFNEEMEKVKKSVKSVRKNVLVCFRKCVGRGAAAPFRPRQSHGCFYIISGY